MNFGFYISGNSTRLSKFLEQAESGIVKQIKVVVSDEAIPPNMRQVLEKYGIETVEYRYEDIPGNSNKEKNAYFSDRLLFELDRCNIDYCISFGGHILSGRLLKDYMYKLINFHPAILPMFPGCKAVDQAVAHGNVLLAGNTAHFIDEGVDTGPIIMQSVTMLENFLISNGDYDVILDLQIPMLNTLLDILMHDDLEITGKRVHIKNAVYSKAAFYPEYQGGADSE